MQMVELPGVSFGGVSRREGWSACGRSEYQMGRERHDGLSLQKERGGHIVTHVRQWLFVPKDVDPGTWSRDRIWQAAGEAERRRDSREARYFDIVWPRQLGTEWVESCVEELFRPLVDIGLAVQVDWERSPAKDGLPNDHLHGLISTRALSNDGFARRKCRELDVWFRFDVRVRVAEAFNSLAKTQNLEISFDPRPNVEREGTLPPEDKLPKRVLGGGRAGGDSPLLKRRDAQRQLRDEHQKIKKRIEALNADRQAALDALEQAFADLSVLTSLQASTEGLAPLSVEGAMAALMERGIVVEQHMPIENVGLVLVIGDTLMVDQGDRILLEEPIRERGARALHSLARCKGWRDLALMDSSGMPMPVPTDPGVVFSPVSPGPGWSRLERLGKHHVVQAVNAIVGLLRSAGPEERANTLGRVSRWQNPHLIRMVAQLVAYAQSETESPVPARTIKQMTMHALAGRSDLLSVFQLEQDLVAMTVPGNALSRPFRPHPRHLDYYGHGEEPGSVFMGDEMEGAV